MLGKSMKHVIEETNAGVDADGLGRGGLRGVSIGTAQELAVCVLRECAAIEIDGKKNLCLVSIASECR